MFGSHGDSGGGGGGGFPNFHSSFDYDTFFGRNRQGSGRRSSSDHTFSFTFDDLFDGNPFGGDDFDGGPFGGGPFGGGPFGGGPFGGGPFGGGPFSNFFSDGYDDDYDDEPDDFYGFRGRGNMHRDVYENEAPFGDFGDIHYRQSSQSFRGSGECTRLSRGGGGGGGQGYVIAVAQLCWSLARLACQHTLTVAVSGTNSTVPLAFLLPY